MLNDLRGLVEKIVYKIMVSLCSFSFLVFEVKQEPRQLGLNDYMHA